MTSSLSAKLYSGEAVDLAVQTGYRHIDCAAAYCNEKEIGRVFQTIFSSGKCKREDLFVTSKLWNTCHKKEHVVAACKQTLSDLGLEYLDLYLVHWPVAFEYTGLPITGDIAMPLDSNRKPRLVSVSLKETWQAMESLVHSGLVKNIGVSNFHIVELLDLMTYCEIQPAVNQIEMHIYNQQEDLRAFCAKHNIHVTAYSPLGSGRMGPLQDPLVQKIAQQLGKTPAQVCLAWARNKGVSVIPKSVTPKRIEENFDCGFALTTEMMQQLATLDKQQIVCDTKEYWNLAVNS
ncbi:Aldose reductase A [Galdieria sulphuraria]|nr:Aldose reductase A [Galdieria sulphuraria]